MHPDVAINHDFPVLHAPAYAPNLAGVAVEGYVWSFCCRGFLDFEEVVEFLLFVAFPDVKCGYLSHGFALKNVGVDAFSDYWKLELPEGGQCYHLHIRLYGYRVRNFHVVIGNRIVFVFNGPVLLELSLYLLVHLHLFSSLHVKPYSSPVSDLYNFTILNNDLSILNRIRSVAESSPRSLVLLCDVNFFRVQVVYGYVCICAYS